MQTWGEISLFMESGDKQRGTLHYHAAWASTSCATLWLHPGWDHLGWAAHVLAPAPMQQPSIPLCHRRTDVLPCSPALPFSAHIRGKKPARRKGPSKCQVVCASVKNACRASSLLNAALALVSVMSLDNWIRHSLTLSDSHSSSLCPWQQKPRPGKLLKWTDRWNTLL